MLAVSKVLLAVVPVVMVVPFPQGVVAAPGGDVLVAVNRVLVHMPRVLHLGGAATLDWLEGYCAVHLQREGGVGEVEQAGERCVDRWIGSGCMRERTDRWTEGRE